MAVTQRGSVLVAGDAAASDAFGYSVSLALAGTMLAVGSRQLEGSATDQGGVYIYDWSGSAWVQRGSVLVASDAGTLDYFGASVALSENGLVLAVGANQWDGAYSDQGGVYIYDWSGSAWVQRGSVLIAADPEASDLFGNSVSLSDNGSVLAVGASQWEGGVTDQGAVYVYDWSGSAWVQRGSVLTASDAATTDRYNQVALSGSGTVLVVGASFAEVGGLTSQGQVYIYDWTGGAWVQRGGILTAPDTNSSDFFGAAVSITSDGLTIAVGAHRWEGSVTDQGRVYLFDWDTGTTSWILRTPEVVAADAAIDQYGFSVALSNDATVLAVGAYLWEGPTTDQGGVYIYDVTTEIGTPTAPTKLTVTATDVPTAPTRLAVTDTGTPTAPTALTVTWPTGTPIAPTKLTVTATGTPTAPTALAVIGSGHVPNWTARCLIGGVDISAQMQGQATVTADEGAARIAELTIRPPSGTVAPLDYVGKEITLDYVLVIAGVEVPRRLFTGRIDTPTYNPNTTLLRLVCVDDLQNRVAALDRTVIDGLIGGRYTEAVQGEILDNWDYAQARLTTVQGSLDAGASGGMRVTPWQIASAWATFGEGDLLYDQSSVTPPQRSTLVNRVDVSFEYRYPRLRQRYTSIGWSGTYIDMAPTGFQYPTQQDVAGAAGGSGWIVTDAVYWPAPAAIPYSGSKYVFPPAGSIDMAILKMTQRYSQTITEQYTIKVHAPESVTDNGELAHSLRGALASEFDGTAWESALDIAPLMPTGGEQDYAPDATRADSDYAIQTLLDQANTKIMGSHRSARLSNAILCNPELDLDKKVAIATAGVNASGKVVEVRHTLDFLAGSAITDFSIACFGVGGAGLITPDALDPPPEPAAETKTEKQIWSASLPGLFVATYGVTPYQAGLMGLLVNPTENITIETSPGVDTESVPNPFYVAGTYPVTGFRVAMPGVDDADRNPLDLPFSQDYSILIPSDPLTFTVP